MCVIPDTGLHGKILKSLPLTIAMVNDAAWKRGILT